MIYVSERYIEEQLKPKILFHGSFKQNMKILKVSKGQSTHDKGNKNRIYAGDNKTIASAFTFSWIDPMGITFGSSGYNKGPKIYTMEILKKHLHLIKKPCSIYEVISEDFIPVVSGLTGEYYSENNVKTLKETKYKSSEQCMIKNNVIIKVI